MGKRIEQLLHERNELNKQSHDIGMNFSPVLDDIREMILNDKEILKIPNEEKKISIRSKAWNYLEKISESKYKNLLLTAQDKTRILEVYMQSMFGLGVIEPFLKDHGISEIMINGIEEIYIERDGCLIRAVDSKGANIRFQSEYDLRNVIDRIVSPVNRSVDESTPIVDARLPDGSRVNIVLPPISLKGPIITIRKFPQNSFSLNELLELGTLDYKLKEILEILVSAKFNIIISGGTGSGKTTLLNALGKCVGSSERVITIEDSAELKLSQIDNLVSLEARNSNIEGKGEITIRDLVKSSLRMRPDRIIVGEVRSGEAIDMLQAMNTGHDGSISTVHSNSPQDALHRLETMMMMSGVNLTSRAMKNQISSAIDIIIQIKKLKGGKRKITQIVEVIGIENEDIIVRDICKLKRKEDTFEYTFNDDIPYQKWKFDFTDYNIDVLNQILDRGGKNIDN